jgi:O-antigen/teichoic acid export membrane protein
MLAPLKTADDKTSSAGPGQRGLAGKVVAAGAWTLAGQVATTVASFLATPYGLRALGPELYGIVALVNLIVGYIAFADLAMGAASTKFGAAEYARGSRPGESAVIWTALTIVAGTATAVALVVALATPLLLRQVFALPDQLRGVATVALHIALFGFVGRQLAGVLNTPVLVRLRYRLDSAFTNGPLLLQIILVPVVLWLGGGVIAAVTVIAVTSVASALLYAGAGLWMLNELRRPRLRRDLVGPLLRFGGPLVGASLVGLVLLSLERVLVVRLISVRALAHYTVAMTLGSFVAVAPLGMMNSLFSAFSQLRAAGSPQPLEALYRRAQRLVLLGLPPLVVGLCGLGRPFLSLWAGPEYGSESIGPLCFLALASVAQVVGRISRELLKAHGHTHFVLRFYLIEIVPYILVTLVCVRFFGTTGAAAAFFARMAADCVLMVRAAGWASGFRFAPFVGKGGEYGLALLVLCSPLVLAPFARGWVTVAFLVVALAASTAGYAGLVWRRLLGEDERAWLRDKIQKKLARTALREAEAVQNWK